MNENNAALTGNWNYPTRVRFGAGRVAELPEACKESGIARPLLVTDPQLAAFPMVQDALAANERAGHDIARGVYPCRKSCTCRDSSGVRR